MWKLDHKEAEHWRTDAFKLWCWRRFLRVPWTARRSNQSILWEIILNIHWKDWWWSWSSNTLTTWCEELTHWKRPRCWEKLKAGREGDNRGWSSWMASPSQWTWVWAISGSWWWTGNPGVVQSLESQTVGHDWVTEDKRNRKKVKVLVTLSCLIPCHPMDCNSPGSFVHGISQANTEVGCHSLLQVIFPTQGSNPWSSEIAGKFFTFWATREAPNTESPRLKSEGCCICLWQQPSSRKCSSYNHRLNHLIP